MQTFPSAARFAARIAFDRFGLVALTVSPHGEKHWCQIDNAPDAYVDLLHSQSSAARDPVMQAIGSRSTPIIWDAQTYINAGQADLWEEQAPFGYRVGIATAGNFDRSRRSAFGVERDAELPRDRTELTRLAADVQLFATCSQSALDSLLPVARQAQEQATLTARELEALKWTMEGKTAWETGRIMSISERAVHGHMQHAMVKLGASNKHHAVIKAIRMGFIA